MSSFSPSRQIPFMLLLFALMLPSPLLQAQSNPFTSKTESSPAPTAGSAGPAGALVRMQRQLHEALSSAMMTLKNNRKTSTLVISMAMAFGYGFLHALGPGHRKTVLASLFAGRAYRKRDALYIGMGFAFLHAGSAVVLVFLIYVISTGPLSTGMEEAGIILENGSFIALALIGAYMCISAALEIAGSGSSSGSGRHTGKHSGKGVTIAAVIGAGLIPCPGAALVLSFSLVYRVVFYGIIAVFSMSLGMGAALTLIALTAGGAGSLLRKLGSSAESTELISHIMEIAGGAVITLFALGMLISRQLF